MEPADRHQTVTARATGTRPPAPGRPTVTPATSTNDGGDGGDGRNAPLQSQSTPTRRGVGSVCQLDADRGDDEGAADRSTASTRGSRCNGVSVR